MRYWRLRLELLGPFGTPLSSGTLFGHLCWAMVRRDRGDERLRAFLARLTAEPFLLSDVLPNDRLPRPILAPTPFDPTRAAEHKRNKRKAWVRRDGFLAERGRLDERALEAYLDNGPKRDERRLAHNTIDRHRGATPETGGLYFVDEHWPHADDRWRDLYVATAMPIAELRALVAGVGEQGFGRDATCGRGLFRIDGEEEERQLFAHAGTRFLSLSHGCHDRRMVEPRWKLMTHFGKVGAEALARGGRPWKRPILLLRPGATFGSSASGPLGGWLTDVYQDNDRLGFKVGHHAFHLAAPFVEEIAG